MLCTVEADMGQTCSCFRDTNVYEVLWDYDSRRIDHLTVKQGAQVMIVEKKKSDECTWVKVQLMSGSSISSTGWINEAFIVKKKLLEDRPYLNDGRWYYEGLSSGNEARDVLMDEAFSAGTFVICRPKEIIEEEIKWPEYFMAVKTSLNPPLVVNYHIGRKFHGKYYIFPNISFLSLVHLVCWYSTKNKLESHMLRPDLLPTKPVQKPETSERAVGKRKTYRIPPPPADPLIRYPLEKHSEKILTKARTASTESRELTEKLSKKLSNKRLLNPKDIHLGETIGVGNFGKVYVAKIPSRNLNKVAVKQMRTKDKITARNILREIEIMESLRNHECVIKLFGSCLEKECIWIIMEYMNRGTLKEVLNEKRNTTNEMFEENVLVDILHQISLGMKQVEQCRIVHRDLAARNILVSKTNKRPGKFKVKIGDFGLSRQLQRDKDYFIDEENEHLPWNWMPLESLVHQKFSSKSDVWAFGILMFEVFSHGCLPYYYAELTDKDSLIRYLQEHGHMRKDESLPDHWYCLQRKCFGTEPEDRPTFTELSAVFALFVSDVHILSLRNEPSTLTMSPLAMEIVDVARSRKIAESKEESYSSGQKEQQ